jgi:hypothetical protein
VTWRDDLKRAMIDALVKLGSPMRDKPDIYGWEDYDWQSAYEGRPHPKRVMIKQAGIDYAATTYVEDDWYEFAGTFAPEQNHVYGVRLLLVLLDGTRQYWRYSGNLSNLIDEVLKD